ncbi:MAG: zinc-binding dehydrogenase [Candidatus Odinarchaeota archaeon]
MRAAVLYGPRDVRLESINKPTLKPGWILLKVKAAGICGSDLHLYREKTGIPIASELGEGLYVPGHELAGEICEIGKNVTGFSLGDRVAVEPTINCGQCKWCNAGWYNLCANSRLIGFYYLGGFAEYCAVLADKCFRIPSGVSYEEAATLDCIAVGEHAIKRANVSCEDSVAVLGAGSIGLFTAQAAAMAGAREVFVTGTHEFQLNAARRLNVTEAINAKKENAVQRILDLTEGKGVDKVIEAVGGATPLVDIATSILRRRGVLVVTGIFVKPIPVEMFSLLTKEITVTGAWGYEYWTHLKEFSISLEHLSKGKINAKDLITHKFPLDKASDGFETALNKEKTHSIKVQVLP